MTSVKPMMLTVALALLVPLATSVAAQAASGPIVDTTSGRLHGVQSPRVREFLGVRYARAPVGRLRWAPPQPAARARGLVDATRAGHPCAQGTGAASTSLTVSSVSEDCLFLNVTEPAHVRAGERLPVMVWVHGGGYTSGAGAQYGARRMVDQGHVIVVTINYRLGIFGYMDLPGMRGGGDFGLLDVVQALRWVRSNAAAFGGNPHDVTLFGESAGAMQTCALLTSPVARGLFEKLAGSSGSCNLNWPTDGLLPEVPASTPYVTAKTNEALSLAVARKLGCRGRRALACLRALPVRTLRRLNPEFSDVLAYDTPLLPRDPAQALRTGNFMRIPVLEGGNRNEESSFVAGAAEALPSFYTPATYPSLLGAAFGTQAPRVAQEYSLADGASAAGAFASLITDDSWSCATLAGSRALARRTRVYAYEFADPRTPNVNGVHAPGVSVASAHATDLPYLFNLDNRDLLTNPASRRLSRSMIADWTSFARTGHPTAPGQPAWRPLAPTSDTVEGLDATGIRPIDLAAEHRCAFWQTINPKDRP